MTVTSRVKDELFETNESRPIRIAPWVVPPQSIDDDLPAIRSRGTPWSAEEHEKFLDALAQYPYGPWRMVAEHSGTRTARQAMSHAQKYREKIKRRKRDVVKRKEAQRKEQDQNKVTRATAAVAAVTPSRQEQQRLSQRPPTTHYERHCHRNTGSHCSKCPLSSFVVLLLLR